jgi:hypothetical protein
MSQEQVTFKFGGMMSPVGPHATHEDIFGKGGFVALTGNSNELDGNEDSFLGG